MDGMSDFAVIRRILRLCRGGVSIGEAYTRVSVDTGKPRDHVVDAYLRAHNARLARRWDFA